MTSYAWILEVRPGCEDEYLKRHDEIWPEMTEALKESGIRNYNIFRYGLTLFGYFETDDLEKTQTFLAENDVNARWSEFMAPQQNPCNLVVILRPHMQANMSPEQNSSLGPFLSPLASALLTLF